MRRAYLLLVLAVACKEKPSSLSVEGAPVEARNLPCNATTCANGCCAGPTAADCIVNADDRFCGKGGVACANCLENTNGMLVCSPDGTACVACDPTSCLSGCCRADGRCVSSTTLTCGARGAPCVNCIATAGTRVCKPDGTCDVCDFNTCAGCCDALGICRTVDQQHCGVRGGACTNCTEQNQTCTNGQCVDCDANNCASGCCAGGICSINQGTLCGLNGAACNVCEAPNPVCSGGQCRPCNAATCPAGCCSGEEGRCEKGDHHLECGRGGVPCVACRAPTGMCVEHTCTGCNAETCPNGCCQNGVCKTPIADQTCGPLGGNCADCTATHQMCAGGECRDCNATTCPNGCCSGGRCYPGTQHYACGPAGGGACVACPEGARACDATTRQCVECNAASCPNGCCGSGYCIPQQTTHCGRMGVACTNCLIQEGKVCDKPSGMCVACSPTTCSSGCCHNGLCYDGDQSWACGYGGEACLSCGYGQGCFDHRCQLPPGPI